MTYRILQKDHQSIKFVVEVGQKAIQYCVCKKLGNAIDTHMYRNQHRR
jgi:hypothetical protein